MLKKKAVKRRKRKKKLKLLVERALHQAAKNKKKNHGLKKLSHLFLPPQALPMIIYQAGGEDLIIKTKVHVKPLQISLKYA